MENFIGLKINELLSKKLLTKKQLAEKLGVARNTLDDYIHGTTSIRVDDLMKIAEAFSIPVNFFFDNCNDNSKTIIQVGDGNINGRGHSYDSNSEVEIARMKVENEMLKSWLTDKDKMIALLMDQVEMLKEKK